TQVTSLLNINLSNADNGTLMIYNMTGTKVKTLKLDRLNQLNMSDLTSGIYLAQVVVDNQISVERFIKQ
ncbi:MAG: T9SS type A sorting domain-containing protein, partial [Nonlabens sp.]